MVPKLRFPEFRDEWSVKNIRELSSLVTKGTTPTSIGYSYLKHGVSFVKAENISTNGEIDINFTPKISPECNEILKRSRLKEGDLLFSIAGTLGRTAVVRAQYLPANTNQALAIIRLRTGTDLTFISLYLNTQKIKRKIFQILSIGAQPNLSLEQVGDFKILLPGLDEQQKIAEFLTVVDKKVELMRQRVELLKKYKKGVMQAIFSQKIRFKDENGKDFPDWEEKKLDEIGQIIGGGTPDTYSSKYWGGNIIWLTPTEVKEKYISQSKKTLTDDGFKASSAKFLPKGTVIFTSRATVGDVGIAITELTTNQGFQSIVVNNNTSNEFIYYWIVQNKKVFLRKASGSTFPEISSTAMKKIAIRCPSKEEQQKIADFLTALDDKIYLEESKLEQAKRFKKALLQQMFV